jgi:RNA polymerase sigma-70 factor (ECF subfamily)
MVHVAGSVEDAHDTVQDALVQAYVKLGSFRRTSAFYTWLYRIAFNVSISRRRRARPNVSLDRNPALGDGQLTDPRHAPTDRLEQQERAGQLRAALATLSEEFRTVLVLREMDDLSYESIAEILDLPVGTVRSRLHRARMQLHELLKETMNIENS